MKRALLLCGILTSMGCSRTPADTHSSPPAASPPATTASAVPVVEGEDRRVTLAKAALRAVEPKLLPGDTATNTTMWRHALAPVVPATWPPDGSVVTLVYASGHRMGLADGEQVAAPFARIVTASGNDRLETLGSTLVDRGIQGVRPMRREEMAVPHATKLDATVRALTAASVQAPPSPELKASYCQWKSLNGIIAPDIVAAQPAFFRWLGC